MLRTTQAVGRGFSSRAKKALLILAVLVILAVSVVADCTRETIWVQERDYSGRVYNDYVSCGSSAGNFGYTCDDTGRCYYNPTIDASQYCHCDDGDGGHAPLQ